MSRDITDVKYLKGKLFIRRDVAGQVRDDYGDEMADGNFISELDLSSGTQEVLPIEHPWWYGERSGNTYNHFLEILKHTTGTADLLLTWEGGDEFTGLRVTEGKAEKKAVVQALED